MLHKIQSEQQQHRIEMQLVSIIRGHANISKTIVSIDIDPWTTWSFKHTLDKIQQNNVSHLSKVSVAHNMLWHVPSNLPHIMHFLKQTKPQPQIDKSKVAKIHI